MPPRFTIELEHVGTDVIYNDDDDGMREEGMKSLVIFPSRSCQPRLTSSHLTGEMLLLRRVRTVRRQSVD